MGSDKPYGLYLYRKERKDQLVLKELLQFLRTHSPSRMVSFAYIEAQTSLIPNLSLWENLQIEVGGKSLDEVCQSMNSDWLPLVNLLKNPSILSQEAEPWENFTISLLKGLLTSNKNLLVDMNEDLLSPLMIQNFKKIFLKSTRERSIYLASAHTSLWLDCARSLVSRKNFEFSVEKLDEESIKRHWAAA